MRLFIMVFYIFLFECSVNCCSDVCKCFVVKSRTVDKTPVGQKTVCGPRGNITNLKDFHLETLPNNTIYLFIRETFLSVLPSYGFASLLNLRKLNLSKNSITEIKENAFAKLSLLEKLDLSHNKIVQLQINVFKPLLLLQRLHLEGNLIKHLPDKLFENQLVLKFIDLSDNLLICDCQIKWLIEWAAAQKARFLSKSSCHFPLKLQGVQLMQLSPNDLHCNWPFEFPFFELQPHVNQLVFEKDSLDMVCKVSNINQNVTIFWTLSDATVSHGGDIHMNMTTVNDTANSSLLVSSVYIDSLHLHHSGVWKCHVVTSEGDDFSSVEIMVISDNHKVCPRFVTVDNKGQYAWPETLAGITVQLECANKHSSSLLKRDPHAYYTCSPLGTWENLNTSGCPYASPVTVVLEQFATANFSFSQTNILDSARGLRNYTNDGSLLKDKMDVVFISLTLQRYLQVVPQYHEMADIIIDIINVILSLDKKILRAAQLEDRACSRFLWILEQLPELLTDSTLNRFHNNIAVEEFYVKSESFPGMICMSFIKNYDNYMSSRLWNNGKKSSEDKILHCNMANSSLLSDEIYDTQVDASLQIPSSIFKQVKFDMISSIHSHKLQFIIFHNGLLFPHSLEQHDNQEITSSVISGKIAYIRMINLTDPVIVSLRTAAYTKDIRPVWWDTDALGGRGDWSTNGCSVLKVHKNLITFSCHHLSSYGLLQDINALTRQYEFDTAVFRPCHPAIYVGTFICIVHLIIAALVYCIGYNKLQMSKKTKHSTINTFLCLIMLCLVFSTGVHQTDIAPVCQAIGLILHYLTLCSLMWMLITASNLYKSISKTSPPELSSDEVLPDHPLPPKPILRFYLVGWGISSIVCGISAAVHIENYSENNYCFLALNPSLGALYGPAVILLVIISCIYILIMCALRDHSLGKESYLGGDNVVMELNRVDAADAEDNCSALKDSDIEEDKEYSVRTQLRGHATLLLLFLLAWLSGVAAVGRPFADYLQYDEIVFTVLFCLFSSLTGMFIFFFFCYCRNDARHCLYLLLHKTSKSTKYTETESAGLACKQNSLSYQEKTSLDSKINDLAAANDSNLVSADPNLSFQYSSDHSENSVPVFYDPRQSVVARRFFEKNRRQQKNNIEKASEAKPKNTCAADFSVSNSSQIVTGSQTNLSNCESNCSSSRNLKFLPGGKKCSCITHRMEDVMNHPMCEFLTSTEKNTKNSRSSLKIENSQLLNSNACHHCCSDESVHFVSKPRKCRSHWNRHHYSWNNYPPCFCSKVKYCKNLDDSISPRKIPCRCHCLSHKSCGQLTEHITKNFNLSSSEISENSSIVIQSKCSSK